MLPFLLLLTSLLAVPHADATDLDHRQQDVERRIDRAGHQLDQSSAELMRAVRAVGAAKQDLASARATRSAAERALITAREQLQVARRALEAARTAEADAEQEVARARLEMDRQLGDIRASVVQTAQGPSPSLMALATVLSSQTPGEVTRQASLTRAAAESESATLQRLDAAKSILRAEEDRLEAAVVEVAAQEAAAADAVARRSELLTEARDAEQQVQRAVERLVSRRTAAAAAREADQARLRELRREQDRVAQLLRRQAARALARAGDSGQLTDADGALAWPVQGYISSQFGMRFHPVYRRWSLHDGTDIASPCGTPIRAAADGRVVAAYFNSAYGNRLILNNEVLRGRGVATTYNHMNGFAVSAGQRVQQGDVIGFVGDTGASTGCHLHFMVLVNGRPVDPMAWL